jgi:hypothetical protein
VNVILESHVIQFFWVSESIKIAVVNLEASNMIRLDHGKGRTFYRPLVPKSSKETATKGGLSRA